MPEEKIPEKLEELSLRDLQEKAVKEGLPAGDTEKFTAKAPLIATINALRAANASKRVATLEDKPNPQEEKRDQKIWLTKAERMRDKCEKEPKVMLMLPLESSKDKPGVIREQMVNGHLVQTYVSGGYETAIQNGYKYLVPRGVQVMVPQSVAQLLADSFNFTINAGKNLLVDRIDPETGKPVADRL